MRRTATVLVLVLMLAGCFGDSEPKKVEDDTDTQTTTPTVTQTTTSGGTDDDFGESTDAPEPDDDNETGPSLPELGQPFNMTGTGCREFAVSLEVPVADARRYTNYTIIVDSMRTDRAETFASVWQCDEVWLDNRSIGPVSMGEAGIQVVGHDDRAADIHYYQAWAATDEPRLLERLQALGWNATAATGGITGGPAGYAETHADWAATGWNYTFEAPSALSGDPGLDDAVGWFEAPNGTRVFEKTLNGTQRGSLSASFSASGAAAVLFGDADVKGWIWSEGDLTARVDYA